MSSLLFIPLQTRLFNDFYKLRSDENNIGFAADIYPYYGSDADAALQAGHELKHGLIGPGVYASHGYERSHKEGVENTLRLIEAYTLLK